MASRNFVFPQNFPVPRSFTEHHGDLLQICFGYRPDPSSIEPLKDYLTRQDLSNLAHMVKVEFAASLEKEMSGSEDSTASVRGEPHAYDVFLMETTVDRRGCRLAVCMPTKGKCGEDVWFNGSEIFPLNPPSHKWRVASLSGPARVLQALSGPTDLSFLAMNRDMIFSAVDDEESLADASSRGMNDSQRQAIATVTSPSFRTGFFACQGPPGTGKTTTMVGMISAIGQNLLVTAPSNAAVANVALKLYATGRLGMREIAVFGQNCDASVRFLNPVLRGIEFASMLEKYNRSSDENQRTKLHQDFITWLHVDDQELSLADLIQLCPYFDMDDRNGRQRYENILYNCKVVFCTLNSAGSDFLQNAVKVNTILLDEAGQCPEAEFLIATTFPCVERIIAVGDPKQLPSTVIDQACKQAGYGESWLGRIHKLSPNKVHLLDTQYRMDPKILRFPNIAFYGNRILSGSNVRGRTPYVDKPFLFLDTDKKGREVNMDFSWQNAYEAKVVKSLLEKDSDINRILSESSNPRVIIITPYKAQAKLIAATVASLKIINLEVATVDSFQGQEGDIVIVSTVRTHKLGFVDNAPRINVALTRAKRVLRVVGEASFFRGISRKDSTLRKLADFAASKEDYHEKTKINRIPWSRPNWNQLTVWRLLTNSKYHHSINGKEDRDKNIFANVLIALAIPDYKALYPIPTKTKPSWYISSLRGFSAHQIVWIAREGREKPMIEAYFAGGQSECSHFIQQNGVPRFACVVIPNLSGINMAADLLAECNEGNRELWPAWKMTNTFQNNMYSQTKDLPVGDVQLDQWQEAIACSEPPLLVESRSGTGKTLALLQHAAYYPPAHDEERPILFVTMSTRLRNVLHDRYRQLNEADHFRRPDTMFFAFGSLLTKLLEVKAIHDFEEKGHCTFRGYMIARSSYEKIAIEPHLIENEIGGVILGSLGAALHGRHLTRDEYLTEKRSNIGSHLNEDLLKRNLVYDEFLRYSAWKHENAKFDEGDIVLRLLAETWDQPFSSAYIDEIQDLSYAGIYLVCSIAGKDNIRWICAGDPAQMISPGCSFTFEGLKQTLLSVQNGIEDKLKNVSNLLVNYRTTKDVLSLANEVLRVAKTAFPNAIPYAKKETSVKDLRWKVLLCDWCQAFKKSVKLGANQALIYSCTDPEPFESQARDWIGSHPFTLTTLDSKGLEFDDVIVAFDLDRKVWDVSRKNIASLRMLRELYVAVTRAQRRVVILVKKDVPEMQRFFNRLNCDFQRDGASSVLQEFENDTTPEEWRLRAKGLFENEQFVPAAACYEMAGDQGRCHLSYAQHFERVGIRGSAITEYRKALAAFFDLRQYQLTLDVSMALVQLNSWHSDDDEKVVTALNKRPSHLPRFDIVRLALKRDSWADISPSDLNAFPNLFLPHRGNGSLKRIIGECTQSQRRDLESVLPILVADYFRDTEDYVQAVRVFLSNKKILEATSCTESVIADVKKQKNLDSLPSVTRLWSESSISGLPKHISLLVSLFDNPAYVADSRLKKECFHYFGRYAIIVAVDCANLDRTLLHKFSRMEFAPEIVTTLSKRFGQTQQLEVARWFMENNDRVNALDFVQRRLKKWKFEELVQVVCLTSDYPDWLLREAERRQLLDRFFIQVFASTVLHMSIKLGLQELVPKFKRENILEHVGPCLDELGVGSSKSFSEHMKKKGGKPRISLAQFKKKLRLALDAVGNEAKRLILRYLLTRDDENQISYTILLNHLIRLKFWEEAYDLILIWNKVKGLAKSCKLAEGVLCSYGTHWCIQSLRRQDKKGEASVWLLNLSIKAHLCLDALELTKDALRSSSLAEKNLVPVLSAWSEFSWGSSPANDGPKVPMFPGTQLRHMLLLLAMDKNALNRDEWLTLSIKYGPAVTRWTRLREHGIAASIDTLIAFHAQLGGALRSQLQGRHSKVEKKGSAASKVHSHSKRSAAVANRKNKKKSTGGRQ